MNVLFPIKLLSILNSLETNKKWQSQIHYAERNNTDWYPKDGMTRVALMAPQLMHIVPTIVVSDYFRVRLAYNPDFPRAMYTTMEIYDGKGILLKAIPHREWDTLLSLAIESEMLEILLDINPW